ncbi:hypothetical protein GCM10027066_19210 [Dyella jejuensis]
MNSSAAISRPIKHNVTNNASANVPPDTDASVRYGIAAVGAMHAARWRSAPPLWDWIAIKLTKSR